MNKQELIAKFAERLDTSKAEAERIMNDFVTVIREGLKEGNDVVLPYIGKLKVKTRSARTCRNPQTGGTVEVPACQVVKFTACKDLKKV